MSLSIHTEQSKIKNHLKLIALSGEIISRSQIEHEFIWPKDDPRIQWQPHRTYQQEDDIHIRNLSISSHFNIDKFLEQTKELDLPSQIIELINHRAFQFNSRKRFRECEQWKKNVIDACNKGEPIEILILAFCVINNPTKRIQSTELTTADDVSLLHMDSIARYITNIYPPGAIFQVISDSTFYALPLGGYIRRGTKLSTVALAEYRALKAAAETNWEQDHFPNAIRATIHPKKYLS